MSRIIETPRQFDSCGAGAFGVSREKSLNFRNKMVARDRRIRQERIFMSVASPKGEAHG